MVVSNADKHELVQHPQSSVNEGQVRARILEALPELPEQSEWMELEADWDELAHSLSPPLETFPVRAICRRVLGPYLERPRRG